MAIPFIEGPQPVPNKFGPTACPVKHHGNLPRSLTGHTVHYMVHVPYNVHALQSISTAWTKPRRFTRRLNRVGSGSNDFPRMQRRNRIRVVAGRAQHLVGMGAERRRHEVEAAAAVFEAKAGAGE